MVLLILLFGLVSVLFPPLSVSLPDSEGVLVTPVSRQQSLL